SAKAGCPPVFMKKTKQIYNNFCMINKKNQGTDNVADSTLFVLSKDSSKSQDMILKRAVQETNLQLFNDAIKDYSDIIEQDAWCAIAYFQRGISQCKEMDMLSRFNEDAQYTTVNKTYKIVREQNNDKYESALADFTKTIEIEPEFAFAYYNRAFVKYKLKDLKGAIEDYTRAIQIDQGFGDAYYNRGLLFFVTNDKVSACGDYSKAGELGVTEAYYVIKVYCSQVLK
ncbi:MAG TPA: tetratricopeptide repeat protein, partial [Bacteroidia bacterium]|nr:tetratricopeptide repeat protein [Bacteroidia bacterium]